MGLQFDDIPDQSAAAPLPKFDDLPDQSKPQKSLLQSAIEPITSIPSTYQRMVNESVDQMGQGINQIETGDPWSIAKGLGNVALGGMGYVTSPISAPLHTIVGKPIADVTGSPTAGAVAETAAGFALPVPKGIPKLGKIPEEGPFGVTLSAGEKADDLAMRQTEQTAIRNRLPGTQEWTAQRAGQIQRANENIIQGLDPYGQTIADTPQQAGELVSQGVQKTAATAKGAVENAYAQARAMPGEIHAGIFEGMSQGIKGDLTLGDNPVIIDDKTTPFASKMIDDLDNRISQLGIQNKADPFGPPNPENITGVNLNGVDQMRKRLSAFRKDAYASGNAADGRAASAVLGAFDDRIDQAINSGAFSGDKSAVNAWNNARASYADYRSTFTAGKNDPVGRVVQKIIGDNANDPLTPGKVMDQIIGSSTFNPSSLNIGVAGRLKTILGETSPEWIAAKQGLAQRLMQAGEGEAAFGTGQVAQRMSKFLNSDMAGVIYTPQEQQTLRAYADLMRKITMPPGSYFPSAPPVQAAMGAIRSRIGGIIGALIARELTPPGLHLVGELGGLAVGSQTERAIERMHSGVAKQLPIVADQMQKWSRAQTAVQVAPNPLRQRAAVGATLGLQHALEPLGINLGDVAVQGPGTTQAAPNQQNIPGPPSQQKNGGRIDQQSGFAHGGSVKVTKESVHYRKGKGHTRCGVCTMFHRPNECSAVQGRIRPTDLCDLFEVKKPKPKHEPPH